MDSIVFNVEDFEFVETDGTAEASVSLNPAFRWMKFILTDDLPNKNKHKIPQEEFDNLVSTGTLAPIKMAANVIKPGHDGSFPLGVISHLKKEDNKVKGLAALWSAERPEDVELVVASYKEGKPLNLSWEIFYDDFSIEDDVKILKNVALRATTFVANPAYAGRTPVLEVASDQDNSNSEENDLDEELKKQLEARIAELETALAEKETKIAELETDKASLSEFKASVEAEKASAAKLLSIKEKFGAAGITKDETYFETNKEKLLGMEDAELEFLLQELVSFASQLVTASVEDKDRVAVPPLSGGKSDHKTLAQRLREQSK